MNRRPDRAEPPVEKPFTYIPFANEDAVKAAKAPPAGHHRYDPTLCTGTITGEIAVLTPLHVASGTLELTKRVAPHLVASTPLIKGFVRSGGVRVIPGSTLKGAVRSVVEAITPSTVGKVERRTQIPNFLREPAGIKKSEPRERNRLSPADRLFGVMDYLGQVRFSDACQVDTTVALVRIPALFAPRAQGPARGRKFYQHGRPATGNTPVEAVPAGGRFSLRCDFENLTAAELGVLLLALGQGTPALHLKLGGGKPACYGSVRMTLNQLTVHQDIVANYLTWEGTTQVTTSATYIDLALADGKLVLTDQLRQLQQTLKYPTDRNCPTGNY